MLFPPPNIAITFTDRATEKLALGRMMRAGLSGRVYKSGEHHVSQDAIRLLTEHKIPFTLVGDPASQ